jgi:hypothetical protein
MIVECPYCRHPADPDRHPECPECGCEVLALGVILTAAHDSLRLALLALMENRDRDALDFSYEAWGLKRTHETAAAGLLSACLLRDPIEISRWVRRRRSLK